MDYLQQKAKVFLTSFDASIEPKIDVPWEEFYDVVVQQTITISNVSSRGLTTIYRDDGGIPKYTVYVKLKSFTALSTSLLASVTTNPVDRPLIIGLFVLSFILFLTDGVLEIGTNEEALIIGLLSSKKQMKCNIKDLTSDLENDHKLELKMIHDSFRSLQVRGIILIRDGSVFLRDDILDIAS